MTRLDKHTQDFIQNAGFNSGDNKHVQAVSVVDGAMNIIGGLAAQGYATNDFEEASTTQLYLGKETATGDWLIISIDTTTGVVLRYATVTNNAAVTTYATAWSGRAGLTYGYYSEAF